MFSGATLSKGAKTGLTVYQSVGAKVTDITVGSGATINVYDGAVLSDAVVYDGGTLSAAYGSSENVTISSGATLITSGNGNFDGITTYSGAIISTTISGNFGSGSAVSKPSQSGATVLSGGRWWAVDVDGTTYYEQGDTKILGTGAIVLKGVTDFYIQSGADVSGATISGATTSVYVLSGGVMESTYFENGYLFVSPGGLTSANSLNSEVAYIYAGASSVNDYYYNSGGAADWWGNITAYAGATVISPYIGAQDAGAFSMYVNSGAEVIKPTTIANGGSIIFQGGWLEICFLAGTLIETQRGSVAVENLAADDEILAFDPATNQFRPDKITWTGSQRVVVYGDLPDDLSGYPIRIRAHAFAGNIPNKDLLVTPEHCLFIDGRFVPTRMLVNGRSIHYDHNLTTYSYYHIETKNHAIVRSNGLLSETYLDTGNRQIMRSSGNVEPLSSSKKTWANDAAAPLDVSREFVEPIYRRLQSRADAIGCSAVTTSATLTNDPKLYLLTDRGTAIYAREEKDSRFVFSIPSGVCRVHIMSRSSRPCDTIGPFIDDRRLLGVLIGDIALMVSGERQVYNPHLQEGGIMLGWEPLEVSHCRWTTGAAEFRLPEDLSDDAEVTLSLLGGGPYVDEANEHEIAFAAS